MNILTSSRAVIVIKKLSCDISDKSIYMSVDRGTLDDFTFACYFSRKISSLDFIGSEQRKIEINP